MVLLTGWNRRPYTRYETYGDRLGAEMSLSNHQRLMGAMLIVLTASFTAGCYTVLKHPRVEMAVEEEGGQDCASCHDDADLYHFRDPFMDPYGYYDYGVTRWYGYYGIPWWYDSYWYYPEHDYDHAYEPSQERRPWQRGSSVPSPLPRVGNSPQTPRVDPGPARQSTESNKEERKKDTRSSDKKKKRRLWGRGG